MAEEPLAPRRVDGDGIRESGGPCLDRPKTLRLVPGNDHPRVDGRGAVPIGIGKEKLQAATGQNEARQPGSGVRIVAGSRRAQRSPREVDGHQVRQPVELAGQRLERGHREASVWKTSAAVSPGGASRCLDHGIGVGVDANHQPIGVGSGMGQHESAVTGSQVHRRRGVCRGELGQLADVYLDESASGQESHDAIIGRAEPVGHPSRSNRAVKWRSEVGCSAIRNPRRSGARSATQRATSMT
jgi:hypothetical protein